MGKKACNFSESGRVSFGGAVRDLLITSSGGLECCVSFPWRHAAVVQVTLSPPTASPDQPPRDAFHM
ncbi:hypothetical protein E2C01_084123 [Portunus trituberculatus]|uniref:Uncharacterized protein n=1 Tax=Portunus trituberculatus TaxID=210409 RepID=A0A5B7J6L7_PORTR|nr:hypothetical protein [Portunus trituberculatus]